MHTQFTEVDLINETALGHKDKMQTNARGSTLFVMLGGYSRRTIICLVTVSRTIRLAIIFISDGEIALGTVSH